MTTFASSAQLAAKFGALSLGAALLASCGNMTGNAEAMEAFAESCKTQFTSEGGPAEMADAFCECSVNEMKEQELGAMDMMDQEKMMAIGEKCATETAGSLTE